MSTFDRPQEVEEEIQMHADTLYQRMLNQEQQIQQAKETGGPVPSFPPILSDAKKELLIEDKYNVSALGPDVQKAFRKRLNGLSGEDRVLEEKALQAELQATAELKSSLTAVWMDQNKVAQKRENLGQATLVDKIWKAMRSQ